MLLFRLMFTYSSMPPVTFRILLPLYNDAFPIMFMAKARQDSIMTRDKTLVSLQTYLAYGNKMLPTT